MIELPESYVIVSQINESLAGKVIRRVTANTRQHKFAAFSGDPDLYEASLSGKSVIKASLGSDETGGSLVTILCGDMLLIMNTSIRYHAPDEEVAPIHQLLIEFSDASKMSCVVQIWGSMLCVPAGDSGKFDISYSGANLSPLEDAFNMQYYMDIFRYAKPSLSAKAFLTTELRFPGIGNGVMHDILFNARIHPKRKISTYSIINKERLFHSIKSTLRYMAERGGRDTEVDLFGNRGGYKTILSSKSAGLPCRNCRSQIAKEMFLGGHIYYCPECQPMNE